jgi:hypothetical protein
VESQEVRVQGETGAETHLLPVRPIPEDIEDALCHGGQTV